MCMSPRCRYTSHESFMYGNIREALCTWELYMSSAMSVRPISYMHNTRRWRRSGISLSHPPCVDLSSRSGFPAARPPLCTAGLHPGSLGRHISLPIYNTYACCGWRTVYSMTQTIMLYSLAMKCHQSIRGGHVIDNQESFTGIGRWY